MSNSHPDEILVIHGQWVTTLGDFETEKYDDYYVIDTNEVTLNEAIKILNEHGDESLIEDVEEYYIGFSYDPVGEWQDDYEQARNAKK